MKTKEQLNFIGYYYQEPMMLDGDPLELFKYANENFEVEEFLKTCTIEDFIWVIITLFKDKYANGAQLNADTTASNWREDNGVLVGNIKTYVEKPLYRTDIKDITFVYNLEEFVPTREHMVSFAFDLLNPLENINTVVEDVLQDKNFTKEGDKYILDDDSAIEYLIIKPDYFRLKVNESKVVYFT